MIDTVKKWLGKISITSALRVFLTVLFIYAFYYSQDEVKLDPIFAQTATGEHYPAIQIKSLNKKLRPLIYSINNDDSGEIARHSLGMHYFIKEIKVNEKILTKRASIEYQNKDGDAFSLHPNGLFTGLKYSGKSNFDLGAFDKLTYGLLLKWTKTNDPYEITRLILGDEINPSVGFELALLYIQRSYLEGNEISGFSKASGYEPILADYAFLYSKHILKGQPFDEKAISLLENRVAKNTVAATRYIKSIENDPRVNEKALFILELYIRKDLMLINSLKQNLKLVTPPDNTEKAREREERLKEELRQKQIQMREAEKEKRRRP